MIFITPDLCGLSDLIETCKKVTEIYSHRNNFRTGLGGREQQLQAVGLF